MAFICGSLNSQKEDDFEVLWPFVSIPSRKQKRRGPIFGRRRSKFIKNPYWSRGRDKFEALLADLDDKRQKILTQKGSEDISLVRFVYKNPNEVKPIVVKFRDQRKHDRPDFETVNTSLLESTPFEHQKDVAFVNNDTIEVEEAQQAKHLVHECKKKIKVDQWTTKLGEWWKPWYYFPLFVILILVLLIFYGRSLTILCTSLGWYLVPIVNETLQNSKKPKKIMKKEKLRKSRDKHISFA